MALFLLASFPRARRDDVPSKNASAARARRRAIHPPGVIMSIRNSLRTALLATAFALPAMQAAADPWHCKVTNATESRIFKLQVSEDRKTWGDFDVGRGIAPGATATLVWDPSTDDEACEQWIRAKFSDGSSSPASQQNFCEDLDTPIEFSEE